MASHRLESVVDRLRASDPDGARRLAGARAALSAVLASIVLYGAARLLHRSFVDALAGVIASTNGSVLPNDRTPRARRTTALVVPVVAIVAFTAGTLAPRGAVLDPLELAAVVSVSVWARRFGARGTALGVMGFLGYFFALFFRASPARLPMMLGGIAVGGAIAVAVRAFVLRDGARSLLARTIAAVRFAAASVL
ncbi:MAG TPA: hypothetical protein VHB21_13740, partial [Minicystis sp.]|nr:hypothetical protein [Minicystis sp.]